MNKKSYGPQLHAVERKNEQMNEIKPAHLEKKGLKGYDDYTKAKTKEKMMNKDIFEGHWEEIKGKMKKTWGKLTDDDFTEIEGNQQEIYGKLQKQYGYSKEEAEEAVEDFKRNF